MNDPEGGGRSKLRVVALGLVLAGATAVLRRDDRRPATARTVPTPVVPPTATPVAPPLPAAVEEQPVVKAKAKAKAKSKAKSSAKSEPATESDSGSDSGSESGSAEIPAADVGDRGALAAELAAEPEPAPETADDGAGSTVPADPAPPPKSGRRARKLAALAALSEAQPEVLVAEPADLAPDALDDDEPEVVAKSPAARVTRIVLVVLVVAVCGALPWVVPSLPSYFAKAVPDQAPVKVVHDPVVAASNAFIGPIGVQPPGRLNGVALASAGTPLQVIVPRLQVRAAIIRISGQSGNLVPPPDPTVLGWWQEGPPVGSATGSAVVTGHTVHTGGGAFDNLGKLQAGDLIRVRTAAGWIGYVVQREHTYSKTELAASAAEIFGQADQGRLVLITCTDFNGLEYLSNSVVFASPISDRPFHGSGAAS